MTTAQYNQLITSNSDRLLRYALKLTGQYTWAQDLVQDSFMKLWSNRAKVSLDHAPPFLYRVLYNKMVDDKRKSSRTQLMDRLPEKETERKELEHKDLIEQAFKALTDEQKQIIMLRDWEGYSYKEIAEILESKESLVKVHLFRARKKMKAAITNLNTDYSSYDENK